MNELKPEDVMRALECCVEGTSEACMKCVFGLTPPFPVCKTMVAKYALALLREKDAKIKELETELAKTQDALEDVFKDCDVLKGICVEKNAEIERLTKERDKAQAVCVQMGKLGQIEVAKARAEAISEFAESAKRRLPIISPSVFDNIAKAMKGEHDAIVLVGNVETKTASDISDNGMERWLCPCGRIAYEKEEICQECGARLNYKENYYDDEQTKTDLS